MGLKGASCMSLCKWLASKEASGGLILGGVSACQSLGPFPHELSS